MSSSKQEKDKSANLRREFLKAGVAGAVALSCGSLFSSCSNKKVDEDEMVKVLTTDGDLIEVNKSATNAVKKHCGISDEEARKGFPDKKFVMVIDLAKCNNARKCITACQKMHHLPKDKEWLQVKLMQDNEKSSPYWFPKTCFHCDNPPCVKVCPVNATFKRQDGLVLIDNERCIGCKFCMTACPYSTRVFDWAEEELPEELKDIDFSPETSVPSQAGTVSKCDFCPDMVRQNKLPDCVTACPNGVFYFGDEVEDTVTNGEETVRFSELIASQGGYRYMEDLGTAPRVYYLPPKDRIFPVERGFEDLSDELKERFKDIKF